jgi:putative transcriptional regulator
MIAEMAFKDRLRALRDSAGLSQEKLARAAGVSTSTVVKLEHGPLDPSWETAVKLARALGVRLDDFLDEPTVGPAPKKGPRKGQ